MITPESIEKMMNVEDAAETVNFERGLTEVPTNARPLLVLAFRAGLAVGRKNAWETIKRAAKGN